MAKTTRKIRPLKIDLSKCPPLLKQLIDITGSASRAAQAMGNDVASTYLIAKGKRTMTPLIEERLKRALGKAGNASPTKPVVAQPAAPLLQGRYKFRSRKIDLPKSCPAPIRALLEHTRGNQKMASKMLGFRTSGWLRNRIDGSIAFDDDDAELVRRALAGEQPIPTHKSTVIGPDTGEILPGMAILLAKAARFETLYDAGIAMGGSWVFKRQVGNTWLGIIKLPPDSMQAFKALRGLGAIDIVTP